MQGLKILSLFYLLHILPCGFAGSIPHLPLPLVGRSEEQRGTIPALRWSSSWIFPRQDGCNIGFLPCPDGNSCCPVGQICSVSDGFSGCCPIGKMCSSSGSDSCSLQHYLVCAGDTFCCPRGDTCDRDINDNPQCFDTTGGLDQPASEITIPVFSPAMTPTSSPTLPTFSSNVAIKNTLARLNLVYLATGLVVTYLW